MMTTDALILLLCGALLPIAACKQKQPAAPSPTAPKVSSAGAPATPGAAAAPDRPGSAAAKPTEVSDGPSAEAAMGKRVTIRGVARNAKLSAVVVGEGLHLHCIELQSWPDEIHGKRVVVTGVLHKTDKFRVRVDDAGAISQGVEGSLLLLRDVRYELAK